MSSGRFAFAKEAAVKSPLGPYFVTPETGVGSLYRLPEQAWIGSELVDLNYMSVNSNCNVRYISTKYMVVN